MLFMFLLCDCCYDFRRFWRGCSQAFII
jgi:hypothetical protein